MGALRCEEDRSARWDNIPPLAGPKGGTVGTREDGTVGRREKEDGPLRCDEAGVVVEPGIDPPDIGAGPARRVYGAAGRKEKGDGLLRCGEAGVAVVDVEPGIDPPDTSAGPALREVNVGDSTPSLNESVSDSESCSNTRYSFSIKIFEKMGRRK